MDNKSNIFFQILLLILLIGAIINPQNIPLVLKKYSGIDFYHFWAVNTVLKITKYQSGSPYKNTSFYSSLLEELAKRSADHKFVRARDFRKNPEFTGSPLLYMSFSIFPVNYTKALFLFRLASIFLFIAAVIIIGNHNLKKPEIILFLLISLATLISFEPLYKDLKVGNINSVQLFLLAAAMARLNFPKKERFFSEKVINIITVTFIIFLVLLKLNFLFICIALLIFFWAQKGSRIFLNSTIYAIIPVVIIVLLPCLYFQTWTVWFDWIKYTFGPENNYLICAIGIGNYSSTNLISTLCKINLKTSSIIICLFWALSLLPILLIARPVKNIKDAIEHIWSIMVNTSSNLDLLMLLSITFTISFYPLVWYHYYLLFFIPVFQLFLNGSRAQAILGLFSIIMCSGIMKIIFIFINLPQAIPICISFSWLPLWLAILIEIYRMGKSSGANLITKET